MKDELHTLEANHTSYLTDFPQAKFQLVIGGFITSNIVLMAPSKVTKLGLWPRVTHNKRELIFYFLFFHFLDIFLPVAKLITCAPSPCSFCHSELAFTIVRCG